MRYQPKQINCMRDHTLMQHSHIYPHTNKSSNWITQRCHSCCIVYRHLFLRLFFFFAGFTFRCFQGHSRPASGQPSVSSHPMRRPVIAAPWPCPLLSTSELTGGNARPDTIASQWFYKFLMHSCSCFRFDYLTTSQRDDLSQVCAHH